MGTVFYISFEYSMANTPKQRKEDLEPFTEPVLILFETGSLVIKTWKVLFVTNRWKRNIKSTRQPNHQHSEYNY